MPSDICVTEVCCRKPTLKKHPTDTILKKMLFCQLLVSSLHQRWTLDNWNHLNNQQKTGCGLGMRLITSTLLQEEVHRQRVDYIREGMMKMSSNHELTIPFATTDSLTTSSVCHHYLLTYHFLLMKLRSVKVSLFGSKSTLRSRAAGRSNSGVYHTPLSSPPTSTTNI